MDEFEECCAKGCPARAVTTWELETGSLVFCLHHHDAYQAKLLMVGRCVHMTLVSA